MMRWIPVLLPFMFAACASGPKGAAKVRAVKGSPTAVEYLTAAELEKDLRAKGGEDLEVNIRMLPKGGRIFFESRKMTVAYGEQENTFPFLSVLENGSEIKLCDESDFKSKDTQAGAEINGAGAVIPLKSNTVKFQCDLTRAPAGEFEVRLLDADKQVVEQYVVTPAKGE